MCQLTLLHGETRIVKALLGNLTLVNSTGNKDGHGIYFAPPIKKFYKTQLNGGDKVFEDKYWEMIEDSVGDLKEICLMSHVRSASQTQRIISVQNAHPHQVGNIMLMHNGTLEPDDDKLEIEGRIDSFWFTKRLSEICGRKFLKPELIAKTLEEFKGKYAFLIADLRQPKIIYVVRGRLADLGFTNYYDAGGNNICFAINTMKKNLPTQGLPMFWRSVTGEEIHVDEPKDLDTESIYIYDIPNATLVKTDQEITERSLYTKTPTKDSTQWDNRHGRNWNRGHLSGTTHISAATSDKAVFEVSQLALEMKLSFSELNYIYFLMFGHSILFVDADNLKLLQEFLEKLKKTSDGQGKGKKENLWRAIYCAYSLKTDAPVYLEIYEIADKARFPWFFNANSGLKKHVRSCIQKWNSDG